MNWFKWFAIHALLAGICADGIRTATKLGWRLPLCTVVSPQKSRTEENVVQNSTFLMLPEKPSRIDQITNRKLQIGDHSCSYIESGNFDYDAVNEGAKTNQGNIIHAIRNDYKIGHSELTRETVFDKRKNHSDLVELAKKVLQSDGVIVPVEYELLISKGKQAYPLQLLDVVSFILREIGDTRFNVHFIVYNKDEVRYNDEFYRRQEKEIEEVLIKMFKKDTDFIDVSVTFTSKSVPYEYIPDASKWIANRIALRLDCPKELQQESIKKTHAVKKLTTLQHYMKTSANDVGSNLKGLDFARDPVQVNQLINIANAVETKLNKWMQDNAIALTDITKDFKSHVDLMIDTILHEFDSHVAVISKGNNVYSKKIRQNMVESIQGKLMIMMDSVVLKLQDKTIQEFQNELQTLPVDDDLDLNLQAAIDKYDRQYCALVDKCTFNNLKGNHLYELKAQMHRRDMIENMKDVANHVLEYAIIKGLFRAKFSIVDGIPYIPSNCVTRFITKWISRLKIPLHITLSYLSPTAFGFSNLFRGRIPLKPGLLRYFTGDKEHKTFSDNEETRMQAKSMVYDGD
ncbi:uncharacterized protein BXIN_1297 [Babesia sp. Xinjiang]|uniref:uncharacterized protein n=1 Tax=Babesia sp. Xinjiang TaxID=462227 RepID=UPI000A21935B|nr:uncharacterized protein BXIN_1297 [Babesia sp. Xinjiang]ORM39903.1 hypothetical protein BXIN_1297 [Babesia sp. Xinjiang]